MDKTLQEQLNQTRRNHIVDAAIKVVSTHGFQRATIKQIAREAGVADGTIYNYFKNKEAILLAIVARLSEAEVRDFHFTEAREIEFDQFTTAYIAKRMKEVDENFAALKAIMPELITNAKLSQQIYEQIYAPGFDIAEAYFSHLMANGDLETADPKIVARLFAAPLMGLMLLRFMGDEHVVNNWQAYGEAMAQFLLAKK